MGHTEMLECRLSETGASYEEIAEIKAACDRAASLTRQLLAFGRRQIREPVVVDVNQLLAGLGKMLRRLLGEHITLEVVACPHPALVRFEMGQIEQIIMTLAVRAREAMPAGGAFTIAVDAPVPGSPNGEAIPPSEGWTEVRVIDTGSGIPADAQARIFEPFCSGKPQSWEEGLGLAAAHEMIRQSGGRIVVSSVPGEGTTFRISLPCVTPEDVSLVPTIREPQPLRGTETILLAEDEDAVRDLVRVGLSRLGYRVLDAPDGALAMERAAIHGGPIDLLMTDMVMPGMSGRELADRLVALHPQAKVIYMSGYPDETLGDQGVWKRGEVFLQKPFTPEAVARAVRRAFTGR
jgi:CheY-like chemotaxis protein